MVFGPSNPEFILKGVDDVYENDTEALCHAITRLALRRGADIGYTMIMLYVEDFTRLLCNNFELSDVIQAIEEVSFERVDNPDLAWPAIGNIIDVAKKYRRIAEGFGEEEEEEEN